MILYVYMYCTYTCVYYTNICNYYIYMYLYIYIHIRIGWYVHEENWIKKPNSVYVEDIYVDPDFFFKPGRLRHILDSRLYLEQDDFLTQPSTEHGNGKLIIYLYMVYSYAFPIWTSWKGFDIAMCEYGSLKGTNP